MKDHWEERFGLLPPLNQDGLFACFKRAVSSRGRPYPLLAFVSWWDGGGGWGGPYETASLYLPLTNALAVDLSVNMIKAPITVSVYSPQYM